jgi:hypothetical protein
LLLLWLLLLIALKKAAALVSRVLLKIQNMVYCGYNDGRRTRRRAATEGPDCSSSTRRMWQLTARGLCRLAPLPAHAPHLLTLLPPPAPCMTRAWRLQRLQQLCITFLLICLQLFRTLSGINVKLLRMKGSGCCVILKILGFSWRVKKDIENLA